MVRSVAPLRRTPGPRSAEAGERASRSEPERDRARLGRWHRELREHRIVIARAIGGAVLAVEVDDLVARRWGEDVAHQHVVERLRFAIEHEWGVVRLGPDRSRPSCAPRSL